MANSMAQLLSRPQWDPPLHQELLPGEAQSLPQVGQVLLASPTEWRGMEASLQEPSHHAHPGPSQLEGRSAN